MSGGEGGTGPRARRASIAAPAALLVLLVSLAIGVGSSTPPTPGSSVPAALGLSLSAMPVSGEAPLVVELRATLDPSGATGLFQWTFGDGASYSQVATNYSAVAHVYPLAGTYVAKVFVQAASGDGSASVSLSIGSSVLSVTVSAAPTSGTSPLTVNFSALPHGGTGTFTSFLWRFGDGDNGSGPDLEYTYPQSGNYSATVEVVDSSGRNATASISIDVTGGSGTSTERSAFIAPYTIFLVPAVVAIVAVTAAVGLFFARVLRRVEEPLAPPAVAGSVKSLDGEASGPPSPEELAQATASHADVEDARSLAERILVHLYWYGRSNIDGLARADSSQAGMARRLGVDQSSVSKALGRLVDVGALKVELQHVPGAPRRLKTYQLTGRGEAVARRIRAGDDGRPPS